MYTYLKKTVRHFTILILACIILAVGITPAVQAQVLDAPALGCKAVAVSSGGQYFTHANLYNGSVISYEYGDFGVGRLDYFNTASPFASPLKNTNVNGARIHKNTLVYTTEPENGVSSLVIKDFVSGDTTTLNSSDGTYYAPNVNDNYVWYAWKSNAKPSTHKIMYYVRSTGVAKTQHNINNGIVLPGTRGFDGDGNRFVFSFYDIDAGVYKSYVAAMNDTAGSVSTAQLLPSGGSPSVQSAFVHGNAAVFNANGTVYIRNMTTAVVMDLFLTSPGLNPRAVDFENGRLLYTAYNATTKITRLRVFDLAKNQHTTLVEDYRTTNFIGEPEISGNYVIYTQDAAAAALGAAVPQAAVPQAAAPQAAAVDQAQAIFTGKLYKAYRIDIRDGTKVSPSGSNTPGGIQSFATDIDTNGNFSFIVFDPSNNTSYTVVIACEAKVPYVPAPQIPADEATLEGSVQLFRWNSGIASLSYKLSIQPNTGLLASGQAVPVQTVPVQAVSSIVKVVDDSVCNNFICEIEVDLSELAAGNYSWTVTASNFNGTSVVSNRMDFTYKSDSSINILLNPGFEDSLAGTWSTKNNARQRCNTETKNFSIEGNCALQLAAYARAKQTRTDFTELTGSELAVLFYGRETATANGKLKVRVKYADTAIPTGKINLNISGKNYQSYEGTLNLQAEVSKIIVTFVNASSLGKVWVDDVRLSANPVNLRTPNGHGNSAILEGALIDLPEAPDGFRK